MMKNLTNLHKGKEPVPYSVTTANNLLSLTRHLSAQNVNLFLREPLDYRQLVFIDFQELTNKV